jgi:hypothetical protein
VKARFLKVFQIDKDLLYLFFSSLILVTALSSNSISFFLTYGKVGFDLFISSIVDHGFFEDASFQNSFIEL